ncbi:CYTH domain-containing protein [Flavobacterium sp.]|jgi:adenylate cyclase|uniref:CYTH domain-containing protein n=1 Tax=Flavobacterium sp. TaxID=239 RepID=UPI0037BEE35E
MQEIERKFLVQSLDFMMEAVQFEKIAQGYLNSTPERTVRIRIKDKKGFITIKGQGDETGTTRFEWEKEIELYEAEALLKLCETGVIVKTRYIIKKGNHTFEVDIFEGENKGLIVAEIELSDANEPFEKPNWLAEEVTGEEKYYNAYLSKNSFTTW